MTADHSAHVTRDAHGDAHPIEHAHPDWGTYKWVALVLTIITIVEVYVYYTKLKDTRIFVPLLLVLSAAKFAIVVMFYMHLKYDAKIFRGLFIGPLIVAMTVLISLLFLFGHIAIHAS